MEAYYQCRELLSENKECANHNLVRSIENDVDSYYNFLVEQSDKIRSMKDKYAHLVEYKNCISSAAVILQKPGMRGSQVEKQDF